MIFSATLIGTTDVTGSAKVTGVSVNSQVMKPRNVIIVSPVIYSENVTGVSLNSSAIGTEIKWGQPTTVL